MYILSIYPFKIKSPLGIYTQSSHIIVLDLDLCFSFVRFCYCDPFVTDGDAGVQEEGGDLIHVTLDNVLVFAPGASDMPAFGFTEAPQIGLLHLEVQGIRQLLMETNTCTIKLKPSLGLGHNYDEFCKCRISRVMQFPMLGDFV